MSDWSPDEDGKPGRAMVRTQPEITAKGETYTWLVTYQHRQLKPSEPEMTCCTQMTICKTGDQIIPDHGRVWPLHPQTEDDGA